MATVKVVLRDNVHIRRDGVDHGPGDPVELDTDAAAELVDKGLADQGDVDQTPARRGPGRPRKAES